MSQRASLSPYHRELMLSLAYLGGLPYALIPRLLPAYSPRTAQRDLADLLAAGDVEKHPLYKTGPKDRPVKLCDVWSLTDKGHAYIAAKASDQYPPKPTKLRHKRVLAHDLLAVKTIVKLAELARPADLSGLFVQFETRLHPDERRPIPDALVIMQVGGGFGRTDIIPWTKDPAVHDEQRWRYVIESDNNTEAMSVITGKAAAYRSVHRDPEWRTWWTTQFGPLPTPIWIVANKEEGTGRAGERLLAIHEAWKAAWPGGMWLGTTERSLEENKWIFYGQLQASYVQIASFARPLPEQPAASLPPVVPGPPALSHERPAAAGQAAEEQASMPDSVPISLAPAVQWARPDHHHHSPEHVGHPTSSAPPDEIAIFGPPVACSLPAAGTSIGPTEQDRWRIEGGYSPSWPLRRSTPSPEWMIWSNEQRRWMSTEALVGGGSACGEWVMSVIIQVAMVLGRAGTGAARWWIAYGPKIMLLLCSSVIVYFSITGAIIAWRALPSQAGPSSDKPVQPDRAAAVKGTADTGRRSRSAGPSATPTQDCGTAHVTAYALNLRMTPGGTVLTVLSHNTTVLLECTERQVSGGRWVRVRVGTCAGWVNARYLSP